MWYDRDGKSIEDVGEVEKKLTDPNYKIVKQTTLPDGKWVSTVWLGLDHNYTGNGLPLIFETMVFQNHSNLSELDVERYSTIKEARMGHEVMVNKWAGKRE